MPETRRVELDPDTPDPSTLAEAGTALRAGRLVALPTETVYGVAADASSALAVEGLRRAKGRPGAKPLPLMVSDAGGLDALGGNVPEAARRLARAFWPGPLTIVVPAGATVGAWIHAGTGMVGLRAPDHAVAQGVLQAAGAPLALTSANRSDRPAARTGEEAVRSLGGRVHLVLDAGPVRDGVASTVVEVRDAGWRILRVGGITETEIRTALRAPAAGRGK